ncbi:hypothetical protein DFH07DRAFT_768386 [Mycena maculata]|uniref:Uncharacterized protein n=1 Tax=Mycena maculata TaxID=230809 RepID=A0AAD7NR14_9AGAR|nr:hypothetical protein DFH07DRAFT_768386 [Mycena maculata]
MNSQSAAGNLCAGPDRQTDPVWDSQMWVSKIPCGNFDDTSQGLKNLTTPLKKELEDALRNTEEIPFPFKAKVAGRKPGKYLENWHKKQKAQKYDADGIDIYFLNDKRETPDERLLVTYLFSPPRSTLWFNPNDSETGGHLKPRILELEAALISPDGTPRNRADELIKRVNFIIITYGRSEDDSDPRIPIITVASRLKKLENLCMIQMSSERLPMQEDP